jgi:MFS superfamily sulfate permease-like transporter
VPSIPEREPAASRWRDLGAGLCVAGLLLPESVAYAGLAHVPVAHAFAATLAGLAIYAAWGGSRFAIVAPTSSTAALAAAAVLSVQAPGHAIDPGARAQAMLALVLLAGLALMLLALARQGQLSAYVSRAVLRGFAFALAITIVIRQLPDALGFELPAGAGHDPLHLLLHAATHPGDWHGPSIVVAVAAAALIFGLRRWPRVPASMIVIVLAICAAWLFDLGSYAIAAVGAAPPLALHLGLPDLPYQEWLRMAELSAGMVVLIFAESWGSMRTLALARGDRLDANRELMVLGACNVGAALLQGMAVGAGFSASSANEAAGARSRLAGVAALAVTGAALAFALPALPLLPRPVLAVAVISALWHALSLRPLITLWQMNRDRALLVTAVGAVLMFGVLDGMLLSIAMSLVVALRRFSQPVVRELGELGTTRNFIGLDDHADAAAVPGLLIVRPEEPLFFASAERVVSDIVQRAGQHRPLNAVVLSLEESGDLDSTAVECLIELDRRLAVAGQRLVLARAKNPVRLLLQQFDPSGLGSTDRMYWSVADAVQALRTRPEDTVPAR